MNRPEELMRITMTYGSNKPYEPSRPCEPDRPLPSSPRELIVIARPEARLRVTDNGITSRSHFDVSFLNALLRKPGRSLRPLFRPGKESPTCGDDHRRIAGDVAPPDLSVYFRLFAPDKELDSIARQLCGQPVIDTAYVKPGAVPPASDAGIIRGDGPPKLRNGFAPEASLSPGTLKVRSPRVPRMSIFLDTVSKALFKIARRLRPVSGLAQGYLGEPPEGIGARAVWESYQGGDGAGVTIIDIEGGWNFSHEDLQVNQGGLVGGIQSNVSDWTEHGTAVPGIIGGDKNAFGVTGVCPGAMVQVVGAVDQSSITTSLGIAAAIQFAADRLSPGDIILIELQLPGPKLNFQLNAGRSQEGYIPVEWWDDQLSAIRYATNRGVIVVEAGGNGGEELDDRIYDNNPSVTGIQFGSQWQNPFRRGPADSGAIIVGAGGAPMWTHGISSNVDRSRMEFSNFGSMFDAQGWGEHVETCGGPGEVLLSDQAGENVLYTKLFGGTSSAAAMVAGALGCIQGARKGAGLAPLTPAQARALLRREDLGSPQQDGDVTLVGERIGSRPNLLKMIAEVIPQ